LSDKQIRLLKADEIEIRVQSLKKTNNGVGCILLLYKNARVDMNILDEVYGVTGWKRTHELINGNLFCNIDIWDDEKKQWIRKQDVGVESYTEKEKGQASDSFKRAGFNVGIGRELYTSPFIWVSLQQGEFFDSKGKVSLNPRVHFKVKSIGYSKNKEIDKLEIEDNHHVVRYSLGRPSISGNTSMPNNNQNNKKTEQNNSQIKTLTCEKCGADIGLNVYDYSFKKYSKHLCMNCQKGFKNA
jgi:hypothetical protein